MFASLSKKNLVILVAVVLGLGLAATGISWLYSSGSRSSDTLYNQAAADRNQGRLIDSIKKLDRLVKKDPDYKDAKERLASAITAALAKAEDAIAAGDLDEAQKIIGELEEIDPDNPLVIEIGEKNKEEEKKKPKEDKPAGGDDQTPNDPPPGPSKIDNPDATPMSLVPDTLDGYELKADVEKWDQVSLAGAAYSATDSSTQQQIGTILLVIGKLGAADAQERLDQEKEIFTEEQTNVTVNGTTAYSAVGTGILSVTWTKGDWFFSVQTIPNNSPSTDFLRTTGVDFGTKLGV